MTASCRVLGSARPGVREEERQMVGGSHIIPQVHAPTFRMETVDRNGGGREARETRVQEGLYT